MSWYRLRKTKLLKFLMILNMILLCFSANSSWVLAQEEQGVHEKLEPTVEQPQPVIEAPVVEKLDQLKNNEITPGGEPKQGDTGQLVKVDNPGTGQGFHTIMKSEGILSLNGISIAKDGSIYVTNESASYNDPNDYYKTKFIHKFDPGASISKGFGTPGNTPKSIALDDQLIYVYNNYGEIIYYQQDGSEVKKNRKNYSIYDGVALAIDESHLFVTNAGQRNNIQKFDKAGNFITEWNSDHIKIPAGIAVDSNDNVYLLNSNGGIINFDKNGAYKTTISLAGVGIPKAFAVNEEGEFFILDQSKNAVLHFNGSGVLLNSWGEYGTSEGQFIDAKALALDPQGNLYVVDAGNNRVQFMKKPVSPLQVLSANPIAGNVNDADLNQVMVDYTIDVSFSKAISIQNPDSIQILDGSNRVSSETVIKEASGSKVLQVKSIGGLKSNHSYKLRLALNSILSADGSQLEQEYTYDLKTKDVTPPTVVQSSPTPNAKDVKASTSIHVTYSKELAESDFSTIVLKDSEGKASRIETILQSDKKVLTIKPINVLSNKEEYTLHIPANTVQDTLGNKLKKEFTLSFTTEVPDQTPPTITSTIPTKEAKDVPVSQEISITFSEEIALDGGQVTLATDEKVVKSNVSIKENVLTIKPEVSLQFSSKYVVTAGDNVIKDLAGNSYVSSDSNGTLLEFTTVEQDVTPPTVVSTVPVRDAKDIGVNTEITINFNETIGSLDTNKPITVTNATGGKVAVTSSISKNDPSVVLVKPTEALDYSTKYEVVIPAGAVMDASKNPFAQEYRFNFKTVANPNSGSAHYKEIKLTDVTRYTGMALDKWGNVYVSTDKTVKKFGQDGKLIREIKNLNYPGELAIDDDSNLYIHDYYDIKKFDKDGKEIKFPTDIKAESSGGIKVDHAGNIYLTSSSQGKIYKYEPNGKKSTEWGRTGNGNGEFNSPVAIAFDANGSMFIADKQNKRIQKLDANGKYLTSWLISEADSYYGAAPVNLSVDPFGNVYVLADDGKKLLLIYDNNGKFIQEIGALKPSSGDNDSYYSKPVNVIVDALNNLYVLDSSKKRVQYIDMAPRIEKVSEYNTVTEAPGKVDYKILLTLNEMITVDQLQNIKLVDAANKTQDIVVNTEDNVLEISARSPLATDAKYTLFIASNSIKDSINQGLVKSYSKVIYTKDTTAPFISRSIPSHNGKVTDLSSPIILAFNEAIKKGPHFESIRLIDNENNVVEIAASIDGNVLMIRTIQEFKDGVSYNLLVPQGAVMDMNDLQMKEDYQIIFSAAIPDLIPPTIKKVYPAHGETNVPLTSTITITFDESIQAGEDFRIISLLKGMEHVVTDRRIEANSVILTPRQPLQSGSDYKIVVPKNSVVDMAGNAIKESHTFVFSTGKVIVLPYVVSSKPANQETGVAVNVQPTITFNKDIQVSNIESIRLFDSNGAVKASVRVDKNTITVKPEAELKLNHSYQVVIPSQTVSDQDGIKVDNEYVLAFKTVSNNANLKHLWIKKGSETTEIPDFNPLKTEYSVNIAKNSQLTVLGTAEEKEAKVTVSEKDRNTQGYKVEVIVLAPDGKTTKTYLILVKYDQDTTPPNPGDGSGNPSGGSGGGTGGGSSSGTTAPANQTSSQFTLRHIKALAEKMQSLVVENAGVKLEFAATAFQDPQIRAAMDKSNASLEFGIQILKSNEKQDMLNFELTAQLVFADGTKTPITHFTEPVSVTIDLSKLHVSTADAKKLTGVRYVSNADGSVSVIKLGGKYDANKQWFTFHTDQFSRYGILKANELTTVELTLNQPVALVNGAQIRNDVASMLVNQRTMVPVRFIAESLGAKVTWNEEAQQVTIELDNKSLKMTLGQSIEGYDVAPDFVKDRIFVPLRYISEQLGAYVLWYPSSEKIEIIK
ncbi:Ig-like domain-containing protein [Paenibacillus sp. KN14-4R]|uniref:Ig-like domain-containing protein n=1 Tax=Paenibacillus sp. KN14-4R TaxID=3445773 RepID=UPI003FA0776C